MEDSVFNFSDFFDKNKVKKEKKIIEEQINKVEKVIESEDFKKNLEQFEEKEDFSEDDFSEDDFSEDDFSDFSESNDDNNDYYILYKDKEENFSCDIYVEGAKTDDTKTRLLIETDQWNLFFDGDIKFGKVNIPIKKLSLLEEGAKGKIKLEVIAEETVFIPWEKEFKVKLSKKVLVKVDEKSKKINENKKVPNKSVRVKF